jgi:hypothetical protein
VLVHGTGRHTRELAEVFAAPPCEIVGFADDDASKHGTRLWNWPVVAPRDAASLGATDVVVSSWLHEGAVWARRGVYEDAGLRVHRVYETSATPRVIDRGVHVVPPHAAP